MSAPRVHDGSWQTCSQIQVAAPQMRGEVDGIF
jgi:hypothetical protein